MNTMNAMDTNPAGRPARTARERIEELRRRGMLHAPRLRRPELSDQQKAQMRAEPQAGQLWLASDDEGGMAFLLINGIGGENGDPRVVDVVPMGEEPGMRMPGAPLVPSDRSPLHRDLVPMVDLRTQVPLRLLSTPLGVLGDDDITAIRKELASGDLLANGGWIDDSDDLNAYDHLADLIDLWHKRCGDLPALSSSGTRRQADASGYDEHAAQLYDLLIDVLKLNVAEANAVFDGRRQLDRRAQEALVAAGARPQDLGFAVDLPDDLLVEVEGPLWYAKAEAWERNHGDADPRLALARECYQLHARTKGSWRERLEHLDV